MVLLTILLSAACFGASALRAEASDSITPSSGYNTGSVSITDLHSAGFLSGSTVKLTRDGEAAIAATGVTLVLSTRITCAFDLTGKATGYWNVVVTTGSSSQILATTFEIRPMQAVSIVPAAGYNTGPVNITDLSGAGFPLSGVAVKLARLNEADIPATGVVSLSTRITCAFDLTGKATGYWDVVVTTGAASYTLSQGFTVGLMQVYSVVPAVGYKTGPVNITDLSGAGFPLSGVTVKLTHADQADIHATGVISISTRITCAFDLTGKATGYWDVVVTTGSSSLALPQGFEIGLMQVY